MGSADDETAEEMILRRQLFRAAICTALETDAFPAIVMSMDVDVSEIVVGGQMITTGNEPTTEKETENYRPSRRDPICLVTQSLSHNMGDWREDLVHEEAGRYRDGKKVGRKAGPHGAVRAEI